MKANFKNIIILLIIIGAVLVGSSMFMGNANEEEAFRYSDPVSNEHTAPAERKIAAMLTELREAVENGDSQLAHSYIEKIERLLNERNRICKMSK